ncbi:hypothetical protein BXT86_05330 [candidate division WOR-3 bacterium 4484_100]|uniref:PorV/PorQ family protein n=1 Tax=candidate division WOR-3 bacterium 4484_100 TaxID=1936077 RepID=A0A1V4QE76_UNCW3|nr:MAG: hypothetical protein BXT86_05330 [candidate division WOR-3 bacterium 4484_100]
MNFILLLLISSCYFLKFNPGVETQGLGGCLTTIDEGLCVFHNPGSIQGRGFNFTLSRWLYGTGICTFGWTGMGNALGISYQSYGRVQGYDDYGNATGEFTPYNIVFAMARRFGVLGFVIKGFEQRIVDYSCRGLCVGMGSHLQWGRLSFGVKLDNLGKEFQHNRTIPLIFASGVRIVLMPDFDLFIESKFPGQEFNLGFLYRYQSLEVLSGVKYFQPENIDDRFNLIDLQIGGGLILDLKRYRIGYSFLYTYFSTGHQISVTFSY